MLCLPLHIEEQIYGRGAALPDLEEEGKTEEGRNLITYFGFYD